MPTSLEDRLIVAISSLALFDFEEENRVFERGDDRVYMQLQLQRLEQQASPGVAFPWCKSCCDLQRTSAATGGGGHPLAH